MQREGGGYQVERYPPVNNRMDRDNIDRSGDMRHRTKGADMTPGDLKARQRSIAELASRIGDTLQMQVEDVENRYGDSEHVQHAKRTLALLRKLRKDIRVRMGDEPESE